MKKWLACFLAVFPCLGVCPAMAQQSPQVPVVAAGVSQLAIKTSGGTLFDGYATVGSSGYLFIFNSASAVANGSVTAGTADGDYQDCIFIAAAGTFPFSTYGLPTQTFSAGIVMAFSSTGCDTLTLATAAFLKGRVQ